MDHPYPSAQAAGREGREPLVVARTGLPLFSDSEGGSPDRGPTPGGSGGMHPIVNLVGMGIVVGISALRAKLASHSRCEVRMVPLW